jgi:hypothetical protein
MEREKGKEAIQAYCAARRFATFVIKDGLDYLVPRWEDTTLRIKAGYNLTFDEYLNDMDTRRIIDEVWYLASDDQIEQYRERLNEADQDYLSYTVPIQQCIWGDNRGFDKERHWWYYHLPIKTGSRWRYNRKDPSHG